MASRRDIRVAVYDQLEIATDGLVDPSNIGNEYPDDESQLPAVLHTDSTRPRLFNRGSAPVEETTTGYLYSKPLETTFSILVLGETESEKEQIYSAILNYFEKFEFSEFDESDIQEDVDDVSTLEVNSEDYDDRTPPAYGDRIRIDLGWQRFTEKPISEIESGTSNVAPEDN